jgi:hypothetical protein
MQSSKLDFMMGWEFLSFLFDPRFGEEVVWEKGGIGVWSNVVNF